MRRGKRSGSKYANRMFQLQDSSNICLAANNFIVAIHRQLNAAVMPNTHCVHVIYSFCLVSGSQVPLRNHLYVWRCRHRFVARDGYYDRIWYDRVTSHEYQQFHRLYLRNEACLLLGLLLITR
jgi:hypothetical protein